MFDSPAIIACKINAWNVLQTVTRKREFYAWMSNFVTISTKHTHPTGVMSMYAEHIHVRACVYLCVREQDATESVLLQARRA